MTDYTVATRKSLYIYWVVNSLEAVLKESFPAMRADVGFKEEDDGLHFRVYWYDGASSQEVSRTITPVFLGKWNYAELNEHLKYGIPEIEEEGFIVRSIKTFHRFSEKAVEKAMEEADQDGSCSEILIQDVQEALAGLPNLSLPYLSFNINTPMGAILTILRDTEFCPRKTSETRIAVDTITGRQ